MELVQPIRDKKQIDEMKKVLRKQSLRDWFLFVLGINTGLRVSDELTLKVKNVRNQTHITIKESKTDKDKRFRINGALRECIDEYIERMDDEAWLFPSRKGDKAISRVQAYRILNAAAEKVGVEEIGTHTMRKTFGYHHYKQNKDVAMLQKLFNHSAPSVTLRYIGIEQDEMDASIEDFRL
ncbi:phage integrase family protein [Tumebacillus sp. BK434]|uniref:site-specific integrase n=1 Tax=Tumebacillus sp. BK434 TaxID=2512169 RepID=UPI0010485926|nr:site-specific integrase [Tumebacillus sp. BK434]TCP54439.1 phage integrase family protein [Tumebacillus sp. BK434]